MEYAAELVSSDTGMFSCLTTSDRLPFPSLDCWEYSRICSFFFYILEHSLTLIGPTMGVRRQSMVATEVANGLSHVQTADGTAFPPQLF
jgi:hypothetical protein